MNELQHIKNQTQLTDREIADRLSDTRGAAYHPRSISNARLGYEVIGADLRFVIRMAFPDEMKLYPPDQAA